jgi:hypothetical protein
MVKNVAFVLYTSGLEYDDRVRKEALSLIKLGVNVEIFFITPGNNFSSGITSYGVVFHEFKLFSRNFFKSGTFTFVKSLEFTFRVVFRLRKFDTIWIHDTEPFLIPLFLRKRFIWDLHEIPELFLKNSFLKLVFQFLEKKSQFIIHANSHRLNYLLETNFLKISSKNLFLRNFPDHKFTESTNFDKQFLCFLEWLGESDFIYLQGLDDLERFPETTISAILRFKKFKAVIIGNFDLSLKLSLEKKYGSIFFENFFFTGPISQLETPAYIHRSRLSIIFYNSSSINTLYCEPNRLFQALFLDKPVIVGKNESMKHIVEKYNFGISIDSFGELESHIIDAIGVIDSNYSYYLNNIKLNKSFISWSTQDSKIKYIIDSINNISNG